MVLILLLLVIGVASKALDLHVLDRFGNIEHEAPLPRVYTRQNAEGGNGERHEVGLV